MEILVEPEVEEEAIVDRSQVITNTPMTVVSIAINNQMLDANLDIDDENGKSCFHLTIFH